MAAYDDFATVYDALTEDVNYEQRTKHLLSLFERFDRKPSLLLDLACGTGNFSFEFAKQGIEVIGVDPSEGMLNAALSKRGNNLDNPIFLMQPAEDLELFGTVDGAICMLDSLNHITDYATLCKAIGKVSLFLEKDRLFIFDLNTEYKHRIILGDNTFVKENDKAFCVWQNEYNDNGIVNIFLDLFINTQGDEYYRISEDFCERAYSDNDILKAITQNSLEIVAVFDDLSENPPTDTTERITYIVRKK